MITTIIILGYFRKNRDVETNVLIFLAPVNVETLLSISLHINMTNLTIAVFHLEKLVER